MSLSGSAYITSRRKGGINGFGGQSGQATIAEAAKAWRPSGWGPVRPFVGATIEPCCKRQYYLLLAFMPDTTANQGRVRGVVIEYRTRDGRTYRTYANGATGFCTGEPSAEACKQEDKRESAILSQGIHDGPAPSELTERGTWHH
jgi:hypothetical protein